MGTTAKFEKNRQFRQRVLACSETMIATIVAQTKEEKRKTKQERQNEFANRRIKLIKDGLSFDEIKKILSKEYPDLVDEILNRKIVLKDGTETNAFDTQLEDQIKKYRGHSQGDKKAKGNETDGR